MTKLILPLVIILSVGCTSTKKASNSGMTDESRAVAKAGGQEYVVVRFDKGSTGIYSIDRQKIRNLAKAARNSADTEIKILAWGDEALKGDADAQELPESEIDLADKRARALEDFVENELQISNVETHNMAQKPGVISELLDTDDAQTKTAMQSELGDSASKAIIVLDRED